MIWPARLYTLFTRKGIQVARMGLQPTDELNSGAAVIAGPFLIRLLAKWSIRLCGFRFFVRRGTLEDDTSSHLDICIHPRRMSRVRGIKNINIERLKTQTNQTGIHVSGDAGLPLDVILVNGRRHHLFDDTTDE